MIHPSEVAKFLSRKRDSFTWMKRLSEEQVDRELERLGFVVSDPTLPPLRLHQKVCILICLAYPQLSLFLDMGSGKTRIILELMSFLFRGRVNNLPLILVLVPSESAVFSWQSQHKWWRIPIPMRAIGNSSSSDKWEARSEQEGGFLVMTYPGLARLLSKKEKTRKGKYKMAMDPKAVSRFVANLGAVVYDESTESGSFKTVTFRVCRALSKRAYYRYALAGRPFGRNPQTLWTQQWLVDHGDTLGSTLELFRSSLFSESRGYFGGVEYKLKRGADKQLASIIQHRSIVYASEECITLPPITRIVETVRLPEDARTYYKKAELALRRARGRVQVENSFLRMRQISSGFLGFLEFTDANPEKGEKVEFVFPTNPKQDRLLELIREMPADRKAVVFYEFTHSGRSIMQSLKKEGIGAGWLWSGTKNSQDLLRQFDDDPRMRILVVNWRVGSMALNLQVANYTFMYESPVSPIKREQAERRCYRDGQTRPVFLIDLVCRGTVDQRILDMLEIGADLFEMLVRKPSRITP